MAPVHYVEGVEFSLSNTSPLLTGAPPFRSPGFAGIPLESDDMVPEPGTVGIIIELGVTRD